MISAKFRDKLNKNVEKQPQTDNASRKARNEAEFIIKKNRNKIITHRTLT